MNSENEITYQLKSFGILLLVLFIIKIITIHMGV